MLGTEMARRPRNPFKYMVSDESRHGTNREYYREPGKPKIRIWVDRNHPDFLDHYYDAKRGVARPRPLPAATVPEPAEGTLHALVREYERSAHFKTEVNPLGRKTRLAILESCCAEIYPPEKKAIGDAKWRKLEPKHMRFLQDQKADLPGAANNRIKYLRALFAWATKGENGAFNPAQAIDKLAPPKKDGHHAWTLAEIKKYEKRHPIGTTPRLALDLALYTAARRSDIVLLGAPNIAEDGWLTFRQMKTGGEVEMPVLTQLADSIAASRTGASTFLVTERGQPFTSNGFGNAFRKWCTRAGLPARCTIHGLRKSAASKLAELACSHEEIKAITGHVTSKEVERYTKSARRRLMAKSASDRLQIALNKSPTAPEPNANGGTLIEGKGE